MNIFLLAFLCIVVFVGTAILVPTVAYWIYFYFWFQKKGLK